jgi:rhodanese-related sulfurtransferase
MGGVWEPANLIPASANSVIVRPTGKVLRILYNADENQVFLVCENGELVTLPDCPRCVKIRRVAEKKVADGWIDGDSKEIVMLSCDGTEYRLPLKEAVQYRASIEYIRRQLDSGGYLVDVRDRYTSESEPVGNSVRVPLEELPEWLEVLPINTVLAFFCTIGTRSDRAAEYARRKGFARAYSIGGLREMSGELCKLSERGQ